MTSYILPAIIMLILFISFKKTMVYTNFIEGASKGMKTVVSIYPAILAIMTATAMLEASGAFVWILKLVSPITSFFKIPQEIMPLAIIRPLSGGASLGVLSEIMSKYDPESYISRTASVLMGSTETTFYALCVYFKNTRVKYTKKIIPAAIIGDIVGLIAAVWVCRIIF